MFTNVKLTKFHIAILLTVIVVMGADLAIQTYSIINYPMKAYSSVETPTVSETELTVPSTESESGWRGAISDSVDSHMQNAFEETAVSEIGDSELIDGLLSLLVQVTERSEPTSERTSMFTYHEDDMVVEVCTDGGKDLNDDVNFHVRLGKAL